MFVGQRIHQLEQNLFDGKLELSKALEQISADRVDYEILRNEIDRESEVRSTLSLAWMLVMISRSWVRAASFP